MKKIVLLWIILSFAIISWCDKSHNFMDVDNPNAKEDLKNFIWSWNIPQINTDEIIPDSLSWVRKDAKWYANKIYEENLEEYVDKAKVWLSWATQTLKWFYNDKVDEVNGVISDKVNWAISSELDKIKIK
jgi:hypothetical protein